MEAHSEGRLKAETEPAHVNSSIERAWDEEEKEPPSCNDENNLENEFPEWQLNLRASYHGQSPRLITAAFSYTSTVVSQPQMQKSVAWTPDGSCLIAHSYDNALRTFPVMNDLADDLMGDPYTSPYSTLQTGDNITSFVVSPFFNMQNPSSTTVFHSTIDQPVQCRNVFEPDNVLATYPLFNPLTEEPMRVYCMAFSPDGLQLLCGSQAYIASFELTRPGEPPTLFKTSLGRKAQRRHELTDLRGKVSSMDMSDQGLLAAATFSRNIAIFQGAGEGECVTSFSLSSKESDRSGSGISTVRWCPDGSYLYAAELNSDVIHLYDIRNTGRCLGTLVGRPGQTSQRVDFDLAPRTDATGQYDGYNIVSGGTDGTVRVWEKPHEKEGQIEHVYKWEAHEETVCGIAAHPWCPMIATSAGHFHWPTDDYDSDCETNSTVTNDKCDGEGSGASGVESTTSSNTLSDLSKSRRAAGAAPGWMKIWEA